MLSERGEYCEGLHFKHEFTCAIKCHYCIFSTLTVKACLLFHMFTTQMRSSINILYFRNMDADLFMECEEEELEPWQQQHSMDDSVGNAESSAPTGVQFYRFFCNISFVDRFIFIYAYVDT